MLCPLINDGLIQALQELRMSVGRDFQVVDFSIDPGDTPTDAARKKIRILAALRPVTVRPTGGIFSSETNDRSRNSRMKSVTATPMTPKQNSTRIQAG